MLSGQLRPKITLFNGSPAAAGNTSATIFTVSTRCRYAVLKIMTACSANGSYIWKTATGAANAISGFNNGFASASSLYSEVTVPAGSVIGYFSNSTNQLYYAITCEEYF